MQAMGAMWRKSQQLHVVGSRFFSDIQVTGMTDMSVHQQQDWFRTTARFHNGKKVFEPLGKNALSDTAGLAGLSYCTRRSSIHQWRVQSGTWKYQHWWYKHTCGWCTTDSSYCFALLCTAKLSNTVLSFGCNNFPWCLTYSEPTLVNIKNVARWNELSTRFIRKKSF